MSEKSTMRVRKDSGHGGIWDIRGDEAQLFFSKERGTIFNLDDAIDKRRKRPREPRANWYGGTSGKRPPS